jgi:hypothetical protein
VAQEFGAGHCQPSSSQYQPAGLGSVSSLYLILLPFFWGHIVGGIIYGLGWGAQVDVSLGGIFDVAEKTDHVTQPVHQHGQLPYDDASEEDDHQRQPCEIAHQNRNSLLPAKDISP